MKTKTTLKTYSAERVNKKGIVAELHFQKYNSTQSVDSVITVSINNNTLTMEDCFKTISKNIANVIQVNQAEFYDYEIMPKFLIINDYSKGYCVRLAEIHKEALYPIFDTSLSDFFETLDGGDMNV